MTDTMPKSIFRAYDIRGTVTEDLTLENVKLIGKAIGSECITQKTRQIILGRDGRLSGYDLQAALCEGIQSTGVDVISIGMVPTPVIYFAMYEFGVASCVAITGSHNPPDYNGFKIVIAGETLSAERISALYTRIIENDFEVGAGNKEQKEVISQYIKKIKSDIKIKKPMKLVIDCGNGVAGVVVPVLLKELGFEVEELFCEVDGNFPNHHPDPSKLENLQDLIERVKATDTDLGLAFDGDGDRLGVVDRNGNNLWPDRQMILFAEDILKRNPGAEIIFDVKSSKNLPVAIEQMGGKATMWKTGHSFIKKKLKETGALLAGEMSGHIFFKERWFGFDDGMYSAARLLEILSAKKEEPAAVFKALPDSINTPEINVKFPDDETKFEFMEKMQNHAKFAGSLSIIDIDGLRVDFEDGWGLIRPSNTTPVLVLRFEAGSNESLNEIQNIFKEQMLNFDPELKLEF